MIPKTKHFDWVEDYCLGQLNDSQRKEFEEELGRNPELKEEVNLEMDIHSAINEKEVLNLRDALNKAATLINPAQQFKAGFEMSDDFSGIDELSNAMSPDELLQLFDSLPKAHVYQSELVSNENIHHFYKEQSHYKAEMNDEDFSFDNDLEEFEGLDEAILEKDIFNLRNTLSQVAKSVQQQYSIEEIDEYVSGNLSGRELELFEEEMSKNRHLKQEVELHRELERAVGEIDIRNLRNELSHIMQSETSWNVSEQHIEDFIDGQLEAEFMEEFNAEYAVNTDLRAEVSLRRNVNESIGESDIMSLRDSLKKAKADSDQKEIISLIPDSGPQIKWWRTGVAVAVILLAMAGVLNQYNNTLDYTYSKYYASATWSPERAVMDDVDYLQQAHLFQSEGEYEKALKVYDDALNTKAEKYPYQFWKAVLLQEMQQYEKAAQSYNQVISHGDNTFIEEAEWYKSLCYVKLNKKDLAREQLLAIIEKKGHYEEDAKAVLRRLKYSFK